MLIKELETENVADRCLGGRRCSRRQARRLGSLAVLRLGFGKFVGQPGTLAIGAVECAVEASVFAL